MENYKDITLRPLRKTQSTKPEARTTRALTEKRLEIRAMEMPVITECAAHGLYLSGGSTGWGTAEDGGTILLYKTPVGFWSSDGTDMLPAVGPHLYLAKIDHYLTYPGESFEGEPPGAAVTVPVTHWELYHYVDGEVAPYSWISEKLEKFVDLFDFRLWTRVPLADGDPADVWFQPIAPAGPAGPPGVGKTWIKLTLAAYTALTLAEREDPDIIYNVIPPA